MEGAFGGDRERAFEEDITEFEVFSIVVICYFIYLFIFL